MAIYSGFSHENGGSFHVYVSLPEGILKRGYASHIFMLWTLSHGSSGLRTLTTQESGSMSAQNQET